ncbi:MAG: type II toxin-antitoxin system VapC family toxin [Oculatellaceae cyanobacterium Prado106]|jgi:hypothetical protein|nr:type II toxin-antitoxin system VapC family toxin [Oculatellaceae cyanobacterium Prado106]
MSIYFIDSSALVKRYISEIGSQWVLDLFDPTLENDIFVAAITGVEIVAAITRRSRGGSIADSDADTARNQLKRDLKEEYQVVQLLESILVSGMALAETHGLRGYDAIQLAAGCAINSLSISNGLAPIIFVSADNYLNTAAMNEGLDIENPNQYPPNQYP